MKKTCTMLLSLLLSLLMCMTALADTTSKNDMITIQNLIAERMKKLYSLKWARRYRLKVNVCLL